MGWKAGSLSGDFIGGDVAGATGTETGFLFFGSFVSGTLGGCDGTTPGPVNGGRIELSGGYTIGVLGDKDGATPLIVWGSGGDTSGGSTGGGCKMSGWDAGLGALLLFARSGGPLIGGIAEKVAGDGETSYPVDP